MAQETIDIVTRIDDGNSKKTIADLRKETKGYKDELVNLTEGTEEYNKVLAQYVDAQGQVNRINDVTRASTQNLTTQIAGLTSATAGIVGGFNAIKGVAASLGVENDKLAETFVQLQSGLAIVQGLQQFSTGIKAARLAVIAFNATIAANPLVAFTVALVAVTGAVAALTSDIFNNRKEVDELATSYNSLQRSIELTNDELEREVRFLKATGAAQSEIITLRRKNNNQEIAQLEAHLDSLYDKQVNASKKERKLIQAQIEETNQQLNAAYKTQKSLNDDYTEYEIKEGVERNKRAVENGKKRLDENKKVETELLKQQQDLNKALDSLAQQRFDQANAAEKALTVDERRIEFIKNEIENNASLREELQRQIDSGTDPKQRAEAVRELVAAEREQASLQKELLDTEKTVTEQRIELEKQLKIAQGYPEDWTADDIEAFKNQEIQNEIDRLKLIADNEEATYDQRIEALTSYNKLVDKQRADQKKKDDEKEARDKKIREESLKASAQFLAAGAQLLGENTVAGKAIQVAGATIDTYRAGTLALASAPPPANYALLAATIATGLATVKNILGTSVPGATDTTSGASIPSLQSFPELETPIQENYSYVDGFDSETLNRNNGNVLVVEDYRRVDNKLRIAENEATF